jgi:hypothetical protein
MARYVNTHFTKEIQMLNTNEKMLNITNHQENAIKISLNAPSSDEIKVKKTNKC